MTNSKQKHGEYIKYDDTGRITNIDWYTDGNHDCSLEVSDGEHSYNHGNETLWQKYTLKDGKPDGDWVLYHSNGQMSIYRNHKNGLRNGIWKSWHDDGSQWDEQTYSNGKKEGIGRGWRYDEIPD